MESCQQAYDYAIGKCDNGRNISQYPENSFATIASYIVRENLTDDEAEVFGIPDDVLCAYELATAILRWKGITIFAPMSDEELEEVLLWENRDIPTWSDDIRDRMVKRELLERINGKIPVFDLPEYSQGNYSYFDADLILGICEYFGICNFEERMSA